MPSSSFRCALCGAGPLTRAEVRSHLQAVHPDAARGAPAPRPVEATRPAARPPAVDTWQAQVTYWDAGGARVTTLRHDA